TASTWPASTNSPSFTRISRIRPAALAAMSISTASMRPLPNISPLSVWSLTQKDQTATPTATTMASAMMGLDRRRVERDIGGILFNSRGLWGAEQGMRGETGILHRFLTQDPRHDQQPSGSGM